jgi:hypothetical protein
MKKRIFFGLISLLLLTITPSAAPVALEQHRLSVLDEMLQKETKLFEQLRQDNDDIKHNILSSLCLARNDMERIRLGKMAMSVQKAEKLIRQAEQKLSEFSEFNAFPKIYEIKNKLEQAHELNKKATDELNVFLSVLPTNQLRILEI